MDSGLRDSAGVGLLARTLRGHAELEPGWPQLRIRRLHTPHPCSAPIFVPRTRERDEHTNPEPGSTGTTEVSFQNPKRISSPRFLNLFQVCPCPQAKCQPLHSLFLQQPQLFPATGPLHALFPLPVLPSSSSVIWPLLLIPVSTQTLPPCLGPRWAKLVFPFSRTFLKTRSHASSSLTILEAWKRYPLLQEVFPDLTNEGKASSGFPVMGATTLRSHRQS